MPFERKFSEAEVLDRAMATFWAKGYAGASISDLVAETGLNRGSLYAAYSDKRGIFIAALRRYDKVWREDFLGALSDTHAPLDAIRLAFRSVTDIEGATPQSGCMLIGAVCELSPHDAEIGAYSQEILEGVRRFFLENLERDAASRTDRPATANPGQKAEALLALFLGVRVMNRAGEPLGRRDAVLAQMEALLR